MSRKRRGSFVKLESSTGWEYKFTSRETLNEAYNRYKDSVQLLEKYYIGSLNNKPKSLIKC